MLADDDDVLFVRINEWMNEMTTHIIISSVRTIGAV